MTLCDCPFPMCIQPGHHGFCRVLEKVARRGEACGVCGDPDPKAMVHTWCVTGRHTYEPAEQFRWDPSTDRRRP